MLRRLNVHMDCVGVLYQVGQYAYLILPYLRSELGE